MKTHKAFLILILLSACSTDVDYSSASHEVTLKKSIISRIDDFEFVEGGIEISRDHDMLPVGSNRIELTIFGDSGATMLVWMDQIALN